MGQSFHPTKEVPMLGSEGQVLCDLGSSGPGPGGEAPMLPGVKRIPTWRGVAMPLPGESGSLERSDPC